MQENSERLQESISNRDRPRRRGRKSLLTLAERTVARKEYQRQYYLKNREKARQYQQQYNLMHRKKKRLQGDEPGLATGRQAVKSVFTIRDIMNSSPEKSARMLDMILGGQRSLTM